MAVVWMVMKCGSTVVSKREDGVDLYNWEIMGVFDSRNAAKAAMRPGEKAVPFTLNERLSDESVDYLDGEFEMGEGGVELPRNRG